MIYRALSERDNFVKNNSIISLLFYLCLVTGHQYICHILTAYLQKLMETTIFAQTVCRLFSGNIFKHTIF